MKKEKKAQNVWGKGKGKIKTTTRKKGGR